MKLNLGCGKKYKDGFINIDAFDSTVADKIMSVLDLEFHSNVVAEIEACQLIEHLGYINSTYALAEWSRVLKPGGILLIETPDIETSFDEYIKGDHKTRKELLSWIYGVESQGMQHRLCFPEVLLKNLLEKSGFTDIKTSFLTIEKHHPILRVCCKKPNDYKIFQIISECRKKLRGKNLVDTKNDITVLEQEKIVDFFILKLNQFCKNNDYKVIDELVIDGSIRSVEMMQIFLEVCIHQKLLQKHKVKKHLELLDFLISIHLSDLLTYLIKESPAIAGTQAKTFQTISRFAKQGINKILSNGNEGSAVKKSFLKLSKKFDHGKNVVFSDKILEYEAAQLSYQAVKEFILGNFDEAIAKMKEAISLDRNHLLYYWNLGRLMMLTDNLSEAKSCYKDAIKLVKMSDYDDKEKLEKSLQNEIDHFSSEKYGKPIADVM